MQHPTPWQPAFCTIYMDFALLHYLKSKPRGQIFSDLNELQHDTRTLYINLRKSGVNAHFINGLMTWKVLETKWFQLWKGVKVLPFSSVASPDVVEIGNGAPLILYMQNRCIFLKTISKLCDFCILFPVKGGIVMILVKTYFPILMLTMLQ